MSFVSAELANMTVPVPEELVDGRSGLQRHVAVTGYRAFLRLQGQEQILSKIAQSKQAGGLSGKVSLV